MMTLPIDATAPSPSPSMGEGARRADEGGAKSTGRARALRRNETDAESRLWHLLRDRRLSGFKFRRQVPIGRYVADFACYEARLVVELDGSQHADSASDRQRDEELKQRGFIVIRVWNNELTQNRNGVLEAIFRLLQRRTTRGEPASVAPPSSGLRPPSPSREKVKEPRLRWASYD